MLRAASVRRSAALLGAITLVCVSLGLAAVNTSLQSPDGLVRSVARAFPSNAGFRAQQRGKAAAVNSITQAIGNIAM